MVVLYAQVAFSTGSACHSGADSMSTVLLAVGCDPNYGLGTLRLSLGRHTTSQDIEMAVDHIVQGYARIRQLTL